MALFDPPFGENGERRPPTGTERDLGFPCGPADRGLFADLHHRVESELGHLITFAGIAQTDDRYTQVREAVQALIAAATGSGDTSQFVLMTQARSRLPIFPEILTADGRIVITAPATGTIRLPGGVQFMHRGIFPITTVQTDFPTSASKIYHLRWNPTAGFTMNDLAGVTYNPSSAAETDASFDSKYDDMLVARIVTNSSNVATITNLANLNRLEFEGSSSGAGTIVSSGSGNDGSNYQATFALNWSRRPIVAWQGMAGQTSNTAWVHGNANQIGTISKTRYSVHGSITTDFNRALVSGDLLYGTLNLTAWR